MNTAEITRTRLAMSDLRAFSPEWNALNAKLIKLMTSKR